MFRGPSPGTVDSRKKALVEAAARQSTAARNRPRTCHIYTYIRTNNTRSAPTKRRRTWCSVPVYLFFPSERTPTPAEKGSVGANRPRRPTTPPPAQRPDGVPTPSGQHRRRDDSLIDALLCFVFMMVLNMMMMMMVVIIFN